MRRKAFGVVIARAPEQAVPLMRALIMSHAQGNVDHSLKEIMRILLARFANDKTLLAALLPSYLLMRLCLIWWVGSETIAEAAAAGPFATGIFDGIVVGEHWHCASSGGMQA
jgi:hypothetical protein